MQGPSNFGAGADLDLTSKVGWPPPPTGFGIQADLDSALTVYSHCLSLGHWNWDRKKWVV